MKHAVIWTLVLTIAVSVAFAQEETSVPPLINYQGMLADANGNPLAGAKKLTFNIYDAAVGGNLVWGPQVFDSVPLVNGRFNVILGPEDNSGKLISDAFGAKDRFIGIRVESNAEIAPRQQILSAPFAVQSMQSKNADTVKGRDMASEFDELSLKLDELSIDCTECKEVNGDCGYGMYMQSPSYFDRVSFYCPDDYPILKGFRFVRCGALYTANEGLKLISVCCKLKITK